MTREKNPIKDIFDKALKHYKNDNLKQAEILLKQVLKSTPKHFFTIFLLGTLSGQINKYQVAKQLLKKAIKINPRYAEAHNNLGNVFQKFGHHKEAISSYQNAIKINPNFTGAYYNLGSAFQDLGKDHEAISIYQKVIKMNSNYIAAHNNLGMVFNKLNQHQEATKCFQVAMQIEQSDLTSHWLLMNTFPIIYENLREINLYRKKFDESIKKINKLLDVQLQYSKKQIIDALKSSTNFYLHYQGKNDLALQTQYGKLVERLTQKIYPQHHIEKKINKITGFIKIGFVSSFFKSHTVTKLFKNWIINLNRNIFSIFLYYSGNIVDETTDLLKDHAHNFFNHTDPEKLINRISKDKLDILVYLDIGMHPIIQILASLRLAPIQCNTFGHPVTSGFKNIDYFFSSQLMEKKDSHKHYTEKLINLPGVGIDYDHYDISNIKKLNIVKSAKIIIFLNLQSLFKLLPQDDHIYLDILDKQPKCCFWFIHGVRNSISLKFKERMSKLFQKSNLSFDKHSFFHPRCTRNEFLGIIEQADIILDSLNWSGGNTSLDAISLNKPIVTFPSGLMRGRVTYSFLKKMNIEETIASSKEKYVEIAVKLSKDDNFRNFITKKIIKNKNKLFNNNKPIKFLEEVIRKKLIN